MDTARDDNTTREGVIPSALESVRKLLRLTIIFHPDVSRIGDYLEIPATNAFHRLGRHDGEFRSATSPGIVRPLTDNHVSRKPMAITASASGLSLSRPAGGSRVQVNGVELGESGLDLTPQQLELGVVIMLAHRVLLLLRPALPTKGAPPDDQTTLIGRGPAIETLREQLTRAATAGLDVLLLGETGTGKELAAREIHRLSNRADKPFVPVNMAAVAPGLAAAELFGNVRGAYTGADRARGGYFGLAEGGYLFLDEIGDLPREVQPQLLRALQQREVQVVGGELRKADLVFVSATDCNLDASDNSFDRALRYRLGSCEIGLPALRQHPEDLGELILHLLRENSRRLGSALPLPGETQDARLVADYARLFAHLLSYDWPGNVRQLENVIRQCVLASSASQVHLPTLAENAEEPGQSYPRSSLRDPAEVSESELLQAMQDNQFEPSNAARQLGISRPGIYRRLKTSTGLRAAPDIPLSELRATLLDHDGALASAAAALKVSQAALSRRLRKENISWR